MFLLFLLQLDSALTVFLYNKERKQNYLSSKTILILFILRWITFILLSIFLLRPKIIKSESVEETPILLFAQDNSRSIISNEDSIFFENYYEDSIKSQFERVKRVL